MSPPAPRAAQVRIPATCGELLQGVDARGPVLVSLPIDLWGTVGVELLDEGGVSVVPPRPRAEAALALALARVGWRGGARARLGAELPVGRGYGSSTVDVVGVLAATARAAGAALDEAELLRLACSIEPTDSSFAAGLALADHAGGRRLSRLGPAPTLWAALVDEGRVVDTAGLHRALGPGAPLPPGTVEALAAALRGGDTRVIGALATGSALRSRGRLAQRSLGDCLDCAARCGAAGIVAAHSGSLVAVLAASRAIAHRASGLLSERGWGAEVHRVVGGGIGTAGTAAAEAVVA